MSPYLLHESKIPNNVRCHLARLKEANQHRRNASTPKEIVEADMKFASLFGSGLCNDFIWYTEQLLRILKESEG